MPLTPSPSVGDPSTELAARRTGMSFQRTRMSADRTLMSVIRTSLALISFGFTIFQFFRHLQESELLAVRHAAPRNFGLALLFLGAAMLTAGIVYHLAFMRGLREQRNAMVRDGLIHGESSYPASFILITAVLLLLLGVVTIASIAFKAGPFQ